MTYVSGAGRGGFVGLWFYGLSEAKFCDDAGEDGGSGPVVVEEGAEAGSGFSVSDQPLLVGEKGDRGDEACFVEALEVLEVADEGEDCDGRDLA